MFGLSSPLGMTERSGKAFFRCLEIFLGISTVIDEKHIYKHRIYDGKEIGSMYYMFNSSLSRNLGLVSWSFEEYIKS